MIEKFLDVCDWCIGLTVVMAMMTALLALCGIVLPVPIALILLFVAILAFIGIGNFLINDFDDLGFQ